MNRYEHYLSTQAKTVSMKVSIPTSIVNTPLTADQVRQIACEVFPRRVDAAMDWYASQIMLGRVVVWTGEHFYAY